MSDKTRQPNELYIIQYKTYLNNKFKNSIIFWDYVHNSSQVHRHHSMAYLMRQKKE